MEVVYSQNRLKLEWKILRATSNNAEDFSRATVYAFAVSCTDVIPLPIVSVERGVITLEVPMGLRPDVYAVKAIWWKQGENKHAFHPFYDFGRHGARVPDIHGGSAGMAMAFRDNLFTITDIMSEATVPTVGATMSFKSHVETYGYDGLSAYEIAVIREMTTVSESEWISNLVELNNLMRSKLIDMQAQITDKLADVSDALKEQHVILSASEYEALVRQGKVDDKVLYGIQDGEKISNLYFGKLPYIGSDSVFITNTEKRAWNLIARISSNTCSSEENTIILDGSATREIIYTYSNGAISSRSETANVEWYPSIGSISGNRLTIPKNTTGVQRTIVITASVGSNSEKVTEQFSVVQDGVTALSVTPKTRTVAASGGTAVFNYSTTGNAGAITVEDASHSGVVATVSGTIASGTISIPITTANESTTSALTRKFVVKSANCENVEITVVQSKAEVTVNYYVGQIGGSNIMSPYTLADFANEDASELMTNATQKSTKVVNEVVTQWMFYAILPQNVTFSKIHYESSGLKTDITIGNQDLYSSVITYNGTTYNVYAYKALPNDVEYELTVNY